VGAVLGGPLLFVEVGGVGRVGPGVAVDRDFAVTVEVVEEDVLLDEGMLVGSDLLAEEDEFGVAVGVRDVAEDLVVGAVLFDDVDDVLDGAGLADALRDDARLLRRAGLCEQRVVIRRVGGDLLRPGDEFFFQVGDGEDFEA
jgi:hypothetical protein